jgi:hypothetical protein
MQLLTYSVYTWRCNDRFCFKSKVSKPSPVVHNGGIPDLSSTCSPRLKLNSRIVIDDFSLVHFAITVTTNTWRLTMHSGGGHSEILSWNGRHEVPTINLRRHEQKLELLARSKIAVAFLAECQHNDNARLEP